MRRLAVLVCARVCVCVCVCVCVHVHVPCSCHFMSTSCFLYDLCLCVWLETSHMLNAAWQKGTKTHN